MSFQADGNTKYVSGGNTNCGNDDFTCMAWIYPTAINQLGTIFGWPGGLGGALMLSGATTDSSGNQLASTAPGVHWVGSVHTFTANSWYHAAWTVDTAGNSTRGRLYKNAVEHDSGTGKGINAASTNYGFGKRLENGTWRQAFTGRLAQLKVWNARLTQEQIAAEMWSKQPLFRFDVLKVWLPCDNVVLPATFPDLSGNGLPGTPQGTPSIADNPPV